MATTATAKAARPGFFKLLGAIARTQPVLAAGFAAGAVRSGVRSGDVTFGTYHDGPDGRPTYGRRPALLSERAAMVFFGGVVYSFLWPLLVWSDVRRVEVAARGLDAEVYETKTKTMMDAIF